MSCSDWRTFGVVVSKSGLQAWVVEADRAAVQDRVLETSKMINGLAEDEKAKEAQAATT